MPGQQNAAGCELWHSSAKLCMILVQVNDTRWLTVPSRHVGHLSEIDCLNHSWQQVMLKRSWDFLPTCLTSLKRLFLGFQLCQNSLRVNKRLIKLWMCNRFPLVRRWHKKGSKLFLMPWQCKSSVDYLWFDVNSTKEDINLAEKNPPNFKQTISNVCTWVICLYNTRNLVI